MKRSKSVSPGGARRGGVRRRGGSSGDGWSGQGERGASAAGPGRGTARPSLSEPAKSVSPGGARRGGVRRRGGGSGDGWSGQGERGASAAGPGRGTARPSLSEPLQTMMIEDAPKGRALERPLHPKKRRSRCPSVLIADAKSMKKSIGVDDAGSSSPNINSEPIVATTPSPKPSEVVLVVPSATPSELMVPTSEFLMFLTSLDLETSSSAINSEPIVATKPSPESCEVGLELVVTSATPSELLVATSESSVTPMSLDLETSSSALDVESGGSGTSTPRKTGDGSSTPRATRATKHRMQLLQDQDQEQKSIEHLFYGSSDEEDAEDDEDTVQLPIPRTVRVFLEDEHDEEGTVPANLNFAWPPPPPTSGSVEPATPPEDQSAAPLPDPLATSNIDKFDFQWRAFPQPQIEPEVRREPFSNIMCGATTSFATPYDAFIAIWDRQIMEHIAVETNRYAQQLAAIMIQSNTLYPQSRITKWVDTTVDELYVYFAIILATGIVVKTRLEEYWNGTRDVFITPEFTTAMFLDRFLLLSRCLHFQNNETFKPASFTRSQAKLFKLQPVLDHLNHKFSNLYNMDQNIALDESLTMWKGWLDINQFINNKAAAVGIKTYEICESKSGYLWRFEVHTRHEECSNAQASPVSGVIPALVLRLLKGLEHRGHTVWMDNFYNSPALARELKCRGFDCAGTLRTNRQLVPRELTNGKMAINQLCGCTSGDVDLIVWRDKKYVSLISTYHGLATVKCGGILKPTVVSDYNICMGGVDRKDQMLSVYPIERKRTAVWYKKFFRRLLNVSTLNAYILFKSEHTTTHRNFRKTLVNELISRHSPQTRTRPSPINTDSKPVSDPQVFEHYPKQYVLAEHNKSGHRYRRNCVECEKRVTTYCYGCNKALCTFTCFGPYHKKLYKDTQKVTKKKE
ncbi:piggyBac transposable element-derived protein 4-like isoform X2 [Ostrinia furnacalis]|uniref:piggyBac transposable element-derived protein 4-like isoform X2 n=1 Tax=Ostrinia furnacalis TaxID=93504 RepID=UPI0010406985|nr:piggyBac transposable element-derived protein 4-like isoform X2 [Ostrinia furnacalis]